MDGVGLKQRNVGTGATEDGVESSCTESTLGQYSFSSMLARSLIKDTLRKPKL